MTGFAVGFAFTVLVLQRVLQRVLQQALRTLKLKAATSDFSGINYEEAKFAITLTDGRKYTLMIAPQAGEAVACLPVDDVE